MGECFCEDSDDTDVCLDILQCLEKALVEDTRNFYRSRNAFFYAPNADPVLLEVKYNFTFAENITEEVLPYCTDMGNSTVTVSVQNQTNMTLNQIWTSRGLYLWIHPLVLNHMQMMFPFSVLRSIRRMDIVRKSPEMETFLWDGTFNLPTLNISLNVTSLPCIPSHLLLYSTTEVLTRFVS